MFCQCNIYKQTIEKAVLKNKSYQHKNYIGNRLADMFISSNFDLIGRNVYAKTPLYMEMGKFTIAEFVEKYRLHTIDIGCCIAAYEKKSGVKMQYKLSKEKVSIGKVGRFNVYDEFDLVAAYNHCVDCGLVKHKQYVSLSEFLRSVPHPASRTAWNERIRVIKDGRCLDLQGFKITFIADPDLVGDSKARASYLYLLDDLQAIYKHFKS